MIGPQRGLPVERESIGGIAVARRGSFLGSHIAKARTPVVAYLRTSSPANAGADKDSGARSESASPYPGGESLMPAAPTLLACANEVIEKRHLLQAHESIRGTLFPFAAVRRFSPLSEELLPCR